MQHLDLRSIEMSEDMVLVGIDETDLGLIHENNDKKYRNKGRVLSVSHNVKICDIGDMVHFSDTAGVFPFKKLDRNKVVLHQKELLFISEDPNILVGEDLTYYLTDLKAQADFGRKASI
jgi:co-chaperonin GroES (HSP10)